MQSPEIIFSKSETCAIQQATRVARLRPISLTLFLPLYPSVSGFRVPEGALALLKDASTGSWLYL